MSTHDFNRGHRAAVEKMMAHVVMMIGARREWAESDEGRKELGPGSPTIPGLQDLYAMRDHLMRLAEIKSDHNERHELALYQIAGHGNITGERARKIASDALGIDLPK